MAESVFALGFIEQIKVLFAGILIYVIIFALLKKVNPFGEKGSGINSLIALITAIIVSFSGIVTYAISYALTWFMIIFFIVFLFILLLLFLGVKFDDVTKVATQKPVMRGIAIAFALLFVVILVKSFFGVNNAFDVNNPPEDPYEVNTSVNFGVDDVVDEDPSYLAYLFYSLDSELLSAVLFLLVIGVFIIFMGRG